MNRKKLTLTALCCLVLALLFIPIASAQVSGDWNISGDWSSPTPSPSPTNSPSPSQTALTNTFTIIFAVVTLLGLVFLVLIGVGVINFDDKTIMIAIVVGVTIVVGLAVALAIMSAISNSNIVGLIYLLR